MNSRVLRILLALVLVVVVPLAGTAAARASEVNVPAVLGKGYADWRQRGTGEVRWLGLRLYAASVWGPGDANGWDPQQPYALALRYARGFSATRLVGTSVDEMRRLSGADDARITRWRSLLEQTLPDVESGDVLIGVHHPGVSVTFHHGDRLLATIHDGELAAAFFSIWFDERTRAPELRKRLLEEAGNG